MPASLEFGVEIHLTATMGDSFFKVIIRDPAWDVRSEAKRLGHLFQLFIDAKKPTEVFIKYKNAKDAQRARATLAENTNVERVESLVTWDIRPKKQTENKPNENGSICGSVSERNAPNIRSGVLTPAPLMGNLPEPMPLMMGLFNMCAACRKGGASFQCFVCGTYYCGEPCQRSDWPGHIIQCLPRLVRTQSGFAANESQPMVHPFGTMPTNNNANSNVERKFQVPPPNVNKPPGPNQKQPPNNRPGSSKQPEPHPKPTTPVKGMPACVVPTNVLKNLSLKRHQEQETLLSAVVNGESQKTPAPATNLSKLAKRVQQKVAAPKREIRYSAFPKEGECVKISYVSSSMLYVYRTGCEADGQFNRYLEFVKRSVECARGVTQMLKTAPKVEDVAFAPFDGDFYRAVVKSIDGTRAGVFFPDFGNSLTVDWTEMKEIPDREIQYGMCYTHAVMLDGVPTFTPLVKAFLTELLELDEFELTKVNDGEIKTVDMRHVQELYQLSAKVQEVAKKEQAIGKEVAEKLAVKETAPALTVGDPASYVPVLAEDFIEADLPACEETQVMVVETSELSVSRQISVLLLSDNAAFGKVMSECQQYGNNDPHPYQPACENEVVLLQFDGVWCRAILAAKGDESQYYMIDLGIIRTLNGPVNCRRYPAAMCRNIFVSECYVDNPDALGEVDEDGTNEQLLGKTLRVTISVQMQDDGEVTCLKIHSIE